MSTPARVRIGAVSYLNTKPLIYGLDGFAPHAQVIFDLPSRLADRLAAGDLDVALIPTVEFFQNPAYTLVSDACIACRGPVLSVKLLSRKPFEQIRTLALDEGSRTSAALVRILLQQQFGLTPQLEPLPIGATAENAETDAVLLIGDRAIHTRGDIYPLEWDLGEQWRKWSGLPFVFAMWTARAGVDLQEVAPALAAARDRGVAHLPEIAEREGPPLGLSAAECLSYFQDNLHFYFGAGEQRGLAKFYQHAASLGLAPEGLELEFDGCQASR